MCLIDFNSNFAYLFFFWIILNKMDSQTVLGRLMKLLNSQMYHE